MLKANFRIDIARAAEDVHRVLSTHENDIHWQGAVTGVRKLSPGPARVGTRYLATLKMMGRQMEVDVEIIEDQPSRLHAISIVAGPFAFETRVRLVASGSGTQVHTEVEGRAGAVARLAAIALSRVRKAEIEKDLQTLKRMMEAGEL